MKRKAKYLSGPQKPGPGPFTGRGAARYLNAFFSQVCTEMQNAVVVGRCRKRTQKRMGAHRSGEESKYVRTYNRLFQKHFGAVRRYNTGLEVSMVYLFTSTGNSMQNKCCVHFLCPLETQGRCAKTPTHLVKRSLLTPFAKNTGLKIKSDHTS